MDVIPTQDRGTITENKPPKAVRTKRKERPLGGILEKVTSSIAIPPKTDTKKTETKKLKKKLQEVALQNQTLAQAISLKNDEITDLKNSVRSLNEVLNSVPIEELRCNSSIVSTKILELSKKNRVLRAELETFKHNFAKKEVEIHKLQKELKAAIDKSKEVSKAPKANLTTVHNMQTKFNHLQKKFFEAKNKNVELQTQLKITQKCLQQEVGENFNINILAKGQPTWQGRYQQIQHLQQNIHNLKQRLEMYEQRTGEYNIQNYNDLKNVDPSKAQSNLSSNRFSVDIDRLTPAMRNSEKLYREKVEFLESEISQLKTQLEEQRCKISALKVRNKNLTDEVMRSKMKTHALEEQTDYNGINLSSMNEKLNAQKYQYENRIEKLSRDIANEIRKREETEFKLEEARSEFENIQEILSNRDKHILKLNEHIERLESDMKAICGEFLFSCRELKKEEFIAILDSLEAEKNMIVEHNKTLNDRIEQERKKSENMLELLSKQKIKIHRMETNIRHLEKELDAQAERKKRIQRVTEYANSVSSATSLSSFVFENSSIGSMIPSTEDMTQPQLEDLKNQLEFANEKIQMLQEKLAYVSEEKVLDAKTFEEIIVNSKSIILDTIIGQRNNILNDLARGDDNDKN